MSWNIFGKYLICTATKIMTFRVESDAPPPSPPKGALFSFRTFLPSGIAGCLCLPQGVDQDSDDGYARDLVGSTP